MGDKMRTVSDIKTALRAKIRSKPKVRGSEFLEMFILEKNKARLEQEGLNVDKKREQINKDIDFIDEELEELQNTVDRSMGSNLKADKQRLSKVSESKKTMKTMSIEY